jgi:hypothetical protein
LVDLVNAAIQIEQRIVDRDETVLSTTYVPGLTVAPGETLRARLVVDGSGSTPPNGGTTVGPF